MILSMTGFGSAQRSEDGVSYSLEIRSLNNRYLKVSVKLPENLQFLEGEVERTVRARLGRGSCNYTLRVRNDSALSGYDINRAALRSYVSDICGADLPEGVQATIDLAAVAALPGVCQPCEVDEQAQERKKALVSELTAEALAGVLAMRRTEGEALREDLLTTCLTLDKQLEAVANQAPNVVVEYQQRLRVRVQSLLAEAKIELERDALMREVAIFADRCDISEEVARMRSHLDQFRGLCDSSGPVGRKLDFVAQEMLREANTIGSKSNDATIARAIVEIKALIDRLKEQVQNVA